MKRKKLKFAESITVSLTLPSRHAITMVPPPLPQKISPLGGLYYWRCLSFHIFLEAFANIPWAVTMFDLTNCWFAKPKTQS